MHSFFCSLLKHSFQDDLPWEHRLQGDYYFGSTYRTRKWHTWIQLCFTENLCQASWVFFSPAVLTDASPCCPNTIKLWACKEKMWHWVWWGFRCSFVAMTLIIFLFSPSSSGIFICFPWRKVLGFPNPFLLIFWRHQERPGHALFFFSVFPHSEMTWLQTWHPWAQSSHPQINIEFSQTLVKHLLPANMYVRRIFGCK